MPFYRPFYDVANAGKAQGNSLYTQYIKRSRKPLEQLAFWMYALSKAPTQDCKIALVPVHVQHEAKGLGVLEARRVQAKVFNVIYIPNLWRVHHLVKLWANAVHQFFINENAPARLFLLYVAFAFENSPGGHANAVIVDKETRTIYRFEPQTSTLPKYRTNPIDLTLHNFLKQLEGELRLTYHLEFNYNHLTITPPHLSKSGLAKRVANLTTKAAADGSLIGAAVGSLSALKKKDDFKKGAISGAKRGALLGASVGIASASVRSIAEKALTHAKFGPQSLSEMATLIPAGDCLAWSLDFLQYAWDPLHNKTSITNLSTQYSLQWKNDPTKFTSAILKQYLIDKINPVVSKYLAHKQQYFEAHSNNNMHDLLDDLRETVDQNDHTARMIVKFIKLEMDPRYPTVKIENTNENVWPEHIYSRPKPNEHGTKFEFRRSGTKPYDYKIFKIDPDPNQENQFQDTQIRLYYDEGWKLLRFDTDDGTYDHFNPTFLDEYWWQNSQFCKDYEVSNENNFPANP